MRRYEQLIIGVLAGIVGILSDIWRTEPSGLPLLAQRITDILCFEIATWFVAVILVVVAAGVTYALDPQVRPLAFLYGFLTFSALPAMIR